MRRSASPLRSGLVMAAGLLGAACPLVAAGSLAAQDSGLATPSAFIESGHWSQDAVRRLAALGLIDGSVAMQAWPIPVGEIASQLESAAFGARSSTPFARTSAAGASSTFRSSGAPSLSALFGQEQVVIPGRGGPEGKGPQSRESADHGPTISVKARGGWSGDRGA